MASLPCVSNRVFVLQLLSALSFTGYVYTQTLMISELENNSINYILIITTVVLLVVYVTMELLENMCREQEYAGCCYRTKVMAAQSYMQHKNDDSSKTSEQFISYFTNEISTILEQNVYLRLFVQKQIIMVGLSFCLLLVLTSAGSILVFISAVFFGVCINYLGKNLPQKQRLVQEAKTAFLDELLELHNGVGEIHINQMEDLAENDFARANDRVEQEIKKYRSNVLSTSVLAVAQNMLIYIIVLICGGILAEEGYVGVGVFISAAELSVQVLNGWSIVAKIYPIVKSSQPMTDQLKLFLAAKGAEQKVQPTNGDILIDIKNASMQHSEEASLLVGVNMTILKGKKYLLCGNSGSGKSTLAELIAGRKSNIHGIVEKYTDKIAYVPQSPFIFSGTLRENLTLGKNYSARKIAFVLEQVELDLDVDLEIQTDGNNLSGGQKSRIALARAMLSDPDLLIIDEVTANLDKELAVRIEKVLLDEYPNMALLQIAHNVHHRRKYDAVFRVENKHVYEVGQ